MNAHDIANESRRGFLLGVGAAALVLAVPLPVFAQDAAQPKYGGEGMPHGLRDDPRLFVAIGADGVVTVICHRSEMGQGVRTSVALVVADELEADWNKVKVQQAPGDEARYGNQNTDGSRSLRHHFMPLRRAGAAARAMLEAAAAATWSVPASECKAQNHVVTHARSGRTLGYGDLATKAAALPVPAADAIALKKSADFRYIGKGKVGLIDGADIVSGRATFGIDAKADGMVYAVVARPPVYGGKVKSFDGAEAQKVPGVLKVVPLDSPAMPSKFRPLGGIAVVATTTWAAIKGREKLKIEWEAGPNGGYDSVAYRASLEAAARKPGKAVRSAGDVDAALAKAAKKVEAEYYLPHIAHATMEPPAALARVADGRCDAWACVQSPQDARDLLAELLGLDASKVAVNVTLLGGGFGRKSKADFVAEAALLSRAMDGKPVKVTWTRDDDLMHDYFHTVSVERLEAGFDADGKVTAWLHRSVAPTITSIFVPDPKHEAPFELGLGMTDTPFAIPNLRLENPEAAAHTRIGWFRSVSNVPHAFAIQSFVAELAAAAGRDPKDFLLELIGPARLIDAESIGTWNYGEDPKRYPIDTGRWRRVVETVAKEAGWGRKLAAGRGLGIAAHRSFVTYVAAVVEVEVSKDGTLTIPRVDIAVDCGPQVNPERVRSQMEGSVVQGVALATLGEITFKDGRAQQTNFHQYQLTRLPQAPREIRVHLIGSDDYAQPLGGVGEPGVPPVAPALVNAVFAATGKRIRALPIAGQLRA
ncbi:xanthine dehydrogenase family protein molybdopterin-binding subunit [Tahibacter soli]|uniref:Molybdopterin-dependent oxidoreductase n=1 Tax=Tahibacter soli TaxID=2983605 RepID=A0A9X3YNB1_9GAMM|nr:molybdopterin cofactor-binding domain-containing protein [Tahibacter soli]MDC8014465.1 molybdopterin-dependent oxidoreductase [Tahibacter soli]